MKKLIIRDHNGDIVLSEDVYMEGEDFIYIASSVTALWVKEIYICNPEDTEKFVLTEREAETYMPTLPVVMELPEAPKPEPEEADNIDCPFERIRSYPSCYEDCPDVEACPVRKGVKENDTEAISDKSTGDRGPGKAEQPKSPKALPEKPARRKATKRS